MTSQATIAPARPRSETPMLVPPGANTAVVHIDGDGTATVSLDGTPTGHLVRASAADVLRVLLNHTATVGREVTVLTTQCGGRRTLHRLHSDGTATPVRPAPACPMAPEHRTREHQHPPRHGLELLAAIRPGHRVFLSAGSASKKWLATHGLWLMLDLEILVLVAALTYMVVALAPYW
jgi:hypothetical protein